MNMDQIGENAGRIWKVLNETGPLGITALKQNAELTDKELYLGLGWLAREDKIAFETKGAQQIIRLL